MKSLLLTLFLTLPSLADNHQEAEALPAGLPAALDSTALEEAGFKALFNGTDLTGWRKTGGTAEYEIQDGAIRGFGEKINKNTTLKGFLALQVHGGKSGDILWKNLYLKEL